MPEALSATRVVPVGFAETYERFLVPAIFRPWANDLLNRVAPAPEERVLDLACGTGIVARLVRDRRGSAQNITGADANPEMIGVARTLAPDISWHVANAMDLPFDAGAFDRVLCQQGLQFFADRATAVRQIRRVLTKRGRVALSTWRPLQENPLFWRLHQLAVERYGEHVDRRFSFGEAERIVELLADAGFRDIRAEKVTRTERIPNTDTFVMLNLFATVDRFDSMPPEERENEVARFRAGAKPAIADFADGDGLVHSMSTNVVTAVVG